MRAFLIWWAGSPPAYDYTLASCSHHPPSPVSMSVSLLLLPCLCHPSIWISRQRNWQPTCFLGVSNANSDFKDMFRGVGSAAGFRRQAHRIKSAHTNPHQAVCIVICGPTADNPRRSRPLWMYPFRFSINFPGGHNLNRNGYLIRL